MIIKAPKERNNNSHRFNLWNNGFAIPRVKPVV